MLTKLSKKVLALAFSATMALTFTTALGASAASTTPTTPIVTRNTLICPITNAPKARGTRTVAAPRNVNANVTGVYGIVDTNTTVTTDGSTYVCPYGNTPGSGVGYGQGRGMGRGRGYGGGYCR